VSASPLETRNHWSLPKKESTRGTHHLGAPLHRKGPFTEKNRPQQETIAPPPQASPDHRGSSQGTIPPPKKKSQQVANMVSTRETHHVGAHRPSMRMGKNRTSSRRGRNHRPSLGEESATSTGEKINHPSTNGRGSHHLDEWP